MNMVSNSLPEGETHPVVRDGLDGWADELDLIGPRTRNKHCTFSICSCFFEIFQKTLVESKPARGMWTSILFLSDRKPLTRKENQFGGLHFLEQPLTRIGAREGTQGFSENSPRDSSRKFSSFYHASQPGSAANASFNVLCCEVPEENKKASRICSYVQTTMGLKGTQKRKQKPPADIEKKAF